MNTFDIAFVIAAGGFALTVWVLLFADTLHPFLDRMLSRLRDRKIRRAQHLWQMQRYRVAIHRWHSKHIRNTDPRTDRS